MWVYASSHPIRISSQLLSLKMGSMAVFCLYYAGQLSDYKTVWYLLAMTLKFGESATVILYFQGKYLDQ
jgi:hypothetical protein